MFVKIAVVEVLLGIWFWNFIWMYSKVCKDGFSIEISKLVFLLMFEFLEVVNPLKEQHIIFSGVTVFIINWHYNIIKGKMKETSTILNYLKIQKKF